MFHFSYRFRILSGFVSYILYTNIKGSYLMKLHYTIILVLIEVCHWLMGFFYPAFASIDAIYFMSLWMFVNSVILVYYIAITFSLWLKPVQVQS
jgi:hypothetical protein